MTFHYHFNCFHLINHQDYHLAVLQGGTQVLQMQLYEVKHHYKNSIQTFRKANQYLLWIRNNGNTIMWQTL